jgi:hypothetical protein
MGKKDETKATLVKMLERERGYSRAFLEDLWAVKEKFYEPYTRDQHLKDLACRFGEFLVTMNVTNVEYSHKGAKTYKTNTGLAPDMITETMDKMFDRFIQAEAHWPKPKNKTD